MMLRTEDKNAQSVGSAEAASKSTMPRVTNGYTGHLFGNFSRLLRIDKK